MAESIRKRKRAAISCTLCRKRKIRCNRETPCSNCIRSRNAGCIYEVDVPQPAVIPARPATLQPRPGSSKLDARTTSRLSETTFGQSASFEYPQHENLVERMSSGQNTRQTIPMTPESSKSIELRFMKTKIAELEEQLSGSISSINLGSAPPSIAPSPAPTNPVQISTGLSGPIDVLQDARSFGRAYPISRGISHKNRVFGQSHWMNGFVVLRDAIEMLEPHIKSGTSNLPAGIHRAKTLARVIKTNRSPDWPTLPTSNLPSKDLCDILVEHYLRTIENVYRILHVPTFKREYETIWTAETEPKTSFMVQLKLVLAIGAILYDENCSMRPEATRWVYEAQTWLSSPHFKSKLGIQHLQTSLLLLLAREFADVGSELVWVSAGALLREAVYIGLHKDPSYLPRMNVYETEMRRRIWNTILELNLQFSLISGGPCLISLEDFNTEPPRNIGDDQLAANDIREQPRHVFTRTSCAIALRKTFPMRLTVVKFLNDITTSGTFEETLRIDTALRASYKTLRQDLQNANATALSPFASSAIDFIMHRYISSLHIPYLNPSLHEALYAFSRKAVFDTSLQLWNLAHSISASHESDLARLCRCGAGFFRAFTFHASTFLAVELRAQLQEEESVPRPDLLTIPEDAANHYMRCIEAGETGIKGYLLLRILVAQISAVKQQLGRTDAEAFMGQAAEDAMELCVRVLERLAGQESQEAIDVDVFDFEVPANFIGDWDLAMSDVFNFVGENAFDTFLT